MRNNLQENNINTAKNPANPLQKSFNERFVEAFTNACGAFLSDPNILREYLIRAPMPDEDYSNFIHETMKYGAFSEAEKRELSQCQKALNVYITHSNQIKESLLTGIAASDFTPETKLNLEKVVEETLGVFIGMSGKRARIYDGNILYDQNSNKAKAIIYNYGLERRHYSGGVLVKNDTKTLSVKPHGKGVLFSGNISEYEGDFFEGLPHGKGVSIFSSIKKKYEGNYRHGVACGNGIMTNENGEIIEGLFEKNLPHGLCRITIPKDKAEYYAYFKEGLMQGEVKANFNGIEFVCFFDQGNFVNGPCTLTIPRSDNYKDQYKGNFHNKSGNSLPRLDDLVLCDEYTHSVITNTKEGIKGKKISVSELIKTSSISAPQPPLETKSSSSVLPPPPTQSSGIPTTSLQKRKYPHSDEDSVSLVSCSPDDKKQPRLS